MGPPMSDSVETSKRVVVDGRWDGNIVPGRIDEMGRDVFVREGGEVTGCIYGMNVRLEGPCAVERAVYASRELVLAPRNGDIWIHSSLGSRDLIHVEPCSHRALIEGDVSAANIHMQNAVIRGNVLGDEIRLEGCTVLGIVQAASVVVLNATTCLTVDAPNLQFGAGCGLLLPYARAQQRMEIAEPVILWAAGSEDNALGYQDIVERKGCKVLSGGRRLTDYAQARRFVDNIGKFLFSVTTAESIRDARAQGGYDASLLPAHLVRMLPEVSR